GIHIANGILLCPFENSKQTPQYISGIGCLLVERHNKYLLKWVIRLVTIFAEQKRFDHSRAHIVDFLNPFLWIIHISADTVNDGVVERSRIRRIGQHSTEERTGHQGRSFRIPRLFGYGLIQDVPDSDIGWLAIEFFYY